MAMMKETITQTYRVSREVDAELRRLAGIHGGIDRALRYLLFPVVGSDGKVLENAKMLAPAPAARDLVTDLDVNHHKSKRCPECGRSNPGHSVLCAIGNRLAAERQLLPGTDLDAYGPEQGSGKGKATTETTRRQKGEGKG
jgi:hypothetical protein